jgi:hypothetical protein
MTDQLRSRANRNGDNLVPLLMGALVVVTVGPAAFTAVMQWLVSRSGAVRLTIAEWWDRNWSLVAFWAAELFALAIYLWWFNRRSRRGRIQLTSVTAGLARVLPDDWDPQRHLMVLRWHGYRPVRLRVVLTPSRAIASDAWRRAFALAADQTLGRTEPITWPTTPAGGVLTWVSGCRGSRSGYSPDRRGRSGSAPALGSHRRGNETQTRRAIDNRTTANERAGERRGRTKCCGIQIR